MSKSILYRPVLLIVDGATQHQVPVGVVIKSDDSSRYWPGPPRGDLNEAERRRAAFLTTRFQVSPAYDKRDEHSYELPLAMDHYYCLGVELSAVIPDEMDTDEWVSEVLFANAPRANSATDASLSTLVLQAIEGQKKGCFLLATADGLDTDGLEDLGRKLRGTLSEISTEEIAVIVTNFDVETWTGDLEDLIVIRDRFDLEIKELQAKLST